MAAASTTVSVPPIVSSCGTCLWFKGRLDNGDELVPPSSAPLSANNAGTFSDADAVLSAYERWGDTFVSRLNGDFSLALIDRRRGMLTLSRDVMASQSLYYCRVAGLVLFASEIKCLLAHPAVTASIDEDGLAELLLDYWCDEHRTCFKGIYNVPPGQSVICDAEGTRTRTDWMFDASATLRYDSFVDYRDHFRSLFAQAVRRRLRAADGGVAITVSGGLDSSSIFCQAADLRRRGQSAVSLHGISMTFPAGTPADEQDFLADIERTYELPITRVPVSQYSYVDDVDVAVRHLGTPGAVESTQLRILDAVRRAGCGVLLSGFFGDQMLSERAYLIDVAKRGRWLQVRHDLRECAAWAAEVDPEFFHHDFWKRVIRAVPPRWLFRIVKRARSQLRRDARYPRWFSKDLRRRALARASSREPQRFVSAHAEQYYRHVTAGHYQNIVRCETAVADAHGIDVRYPFRDRDLVAFLMAIPGDIVNWCGVPKGLLREALTGVLPQRVRDRRWKADFTALENTAMRRDAPRVAAMMDRSCLSVRAGFVEPEAVDALVATFSRMSDTRGALPGWRLTDLVGLEMWLRDLQVTGRAEVQ